jgi:topoisomerase-4 subunit A
MMRRWKLTELQADAILNMKLKALRKLEEIAIRDEHRRLVAEAKALKSLLGDEGAQWKTIAGEVAELKKRFGQATPLGKRRTELGDAPSAVIVPLEALVEREPVTVICSEKGWIRAMKGHGADAAELKYKEGDRGRFVIQAETTD